MAKNVAISEKGRRLLRNRKLAAKVVDAILKDKDKLDAGEPIEVTDAHGQTLSIKLVSSSDAKSADQNSQ